MKLHFTKLDHDSSSDYIILSDKDGNELAGYGWGKNGQDHWTAWFTGDILKVKLTTNGYNTAYGFKIDNMEIRQGKPNTPSSDLSTSSTVGNAPLTEKPTDKTNTPSADFSASQTSGYSPLTVAFTDKSSGFPTAWKWNFGDGSDVLIAYNSTHTYLKPGIYTVKETVSNVAARLHKSKQII